ncbi:hypothetical protein ETB97_004233 [Aspergillus alliaceus]|uniref:Uncharacterized protein n=1 Tax=Petromyces alliaceus TaxID=209559 RepID=A0A8H6AFF8_PETAA|nr:hypothetical protein ETB97_004233 [Aspergillus burnettii]
MNEERMKYEDLENQPDLAKVTSNNEGQAIPMAAEDMTTERGLKSRHAQMLALGATLYHTSCKNFIGGHWNTSNFLTCYIGIPIFMVLYLGHRFIAARSEPRVCPASNVDLTSGLAEVVERETPTLNKDILKEMVPVIEVAF